ncbi:hypothetical protein COY07_04025 [Candidatus Peregrinibacteria bacterium CG_4_10_14_0_2_um_filter_43_11]|nr:MAG: hypothetical protein COY07_04025 [Candidatus Peregrinibacteria bacterium CG_4_10_14_0_2_um_filter_43_11]
MSNAESALLRDVLDTFFEEIDIPYAAPSGDLLLALRRHFSGDTTLLNRYDVKTVRGVIAEAMRQLSDGRGFLRKILGVFPPSHEQAILHAAIGTIEKIRDQYKICLEPPTSYRLLAAVSHYFAGNSS